MMHTCTQPIPTRAMFTGVSLRSLSPSANLLTSFAELPSDKSKILNMGPDQLQCSANKQGKDLIGYRTGWDGSDTDHMSYVVLCANYQLHNVYLDEFTIQSGKSLDDFKSLTTTLFHEFLHVWLPGSKSTFYYLLKESY